MYIHILVKFNFVWICSYRFLFAVSLFACIIFFTIVGTLSFTTAAFFARLSPDSVSFCQNYASAVTHFTLYVFCSYWQRFKSPILLLSHCHCQWSSTHSTAVHRAAMQTQKKVIFTSHERLKVHAIAAKYFNISNRKQIQFALFRSISVVPHCHNLGLM